MAVEQLAEEVVVDNQAVVEVVELATAAEVVELVPDDLLVVAAASLVVVELVAVA